MDYIESRLTGVASANDLEKEIQEKQDVLVSGGNIKTINNLSILGSGNISISVPTITVEDKDTYIVLTIDGVSYNLTKYQG